MPKLKHRKPKTSVIHARIDPRLRYGLDLVVRQQHISVSDGLVQAVAQYLKDKGLLGGRPGEPLSLLDEVWSESPTIRTANLCRLAPDFASSEDFYTVEILDRLRADLLGENMSVPRRIGILFDENFEDIQKAASDPSLYPDLLSKLKTLSEAPE